MMISSAGSDRTCLFWESRRLLSLWDIMMNFRASELYALLQLIWQLERSANLQKSGPFGVNELSLLGSSPSGFGSTSHPATTQLSDSDLHMAKYIIELVSKYCKEIEMDAAAKRLARLKAAMKFKINYSQYQVELKALGEAIEDDLKEKSFYYYPIEKTKLLLNLKQQWGDGFEKFKVIQSDILRATDCYAIGHPMACVFHLMRVMEFGVQRFGKRLGVKLTSKTVTKIHELTWHQILDKINTPLREMKVDSLAKKARQEKYSAMQGYLYAVKDAWRNPTMHPRRAGYSDGEALNIINQVRSFMIGLSVL